MKELSIEQKAKAYDEALERAKNFIENGDEKERTIAESIFAGIMEESRDEKIRKAIINIFATHKDYEIFFGVSVKDILAWLEKQGEQKPADKVEPKFKEGDIVQYIDPDGDKEIGVVRKNNSVVDSFKNLVQVCVGESTMTYHKEEELELFDVSIEEELKKFAEEWDESLYRSDAVIAGAKWYKQQMIKSAKLSGWVARDENGSLHLFEVEPSRIMHRWWDRDYHSTTLDKKDFPDLEWEDEPVYVKLPIIVED